jgi:two-component system repressor protein LuxO
MALGTKSPQPIDVLIIDADPSQRRALAGLIAEGALGRFLPKSYASGAEALAANGGGGGAIMIADLETIGGAGGLSEMARPASPMIATSAVSSLNTAIAAVRAGAIDFLPKPIGAKALFERLETAMAHWQDGRAAGPASGARGEVSDFAGFIGRSPAMAAVYEQIRRMAPSRAPVFITGESGTGKEVCAEAIHAHSGPPGRPFVALNCSAIPRELMESEIFGHVKGAFTGAAENRTGAAELADGGTLFLDEIAEMDFGLQAKLLRFVQTGSLRRVGGSELKRVDVRLVAATNRDPFVEVEAGRFRGDLFYRLHVLPIHLAPLKARREDIMPLAETFLTRFAEEEGRAFRGFDGEATALILGHAWPGNVRELQNVVRRIVVLHDGEAVTRDMLPASLTGAIKTAPVSMAPAQPATIAPFRDQERRIIEEALSAYRGNIARAAAALEISPSTIYRKQQSWADRARV